MKVGYRSCRVRLGVWLLPLLCAGLAPAQRTIHVDDDHPGDKGPGDPTLSNSKEDGSFFSPFDAIQEAIETAQPGDTILVADGVYRGLGNIDLRLRGKAITLRSEHGSSHCTIDCEFLGRGLDLIEGEGPETVVEGFTIRNGFLSGDENVGAGIRIVRSNPTIRDCVLVENEIGGFLGGGAGMYLRDSDARIENCRIERNAAPGFFSRGAGLLLEFSDPVITGCEIAFNEVSFVGGGIMCDMNSRPLIHQTLISHNTTGPSGLGGGIICQASSHATIEQCIIRDNRAISTAGVLILQGSNVTLRDSLIVNNLSDVVGSGIHCGGESSALIHNCTIVGNTKSGISCLSSVPSIENCILAENGKVGDDLDRCVATFSLISDGDEGLGNLRGDPGFRGPDDFRLRPDSRCRDQGNPLVGLNAGESDLGGVPRVMCSRLDIGAYEFGLGDGNCDGVMSVLDLEPWSDCATGPENPEFDTACSAFDYDINGSIDLRDLGAFFNAFGTEIP